MRKRMWFWVLVLFIFLVGLATVRVVALMMVSPTPSPAQVFEVLRQEVPEDSVFTTPSGVKAWWSRNEKTGLEVEGRCYSGFYYEMRITSKEVILIYQKRGKSIYFPHRKDRWALKMARRGLQELDLKEVKPLENGLLRELYQELRK